MARYINIPVTTETREHLVRLAKPRESWNAQIARMIEENESFDLLRLELSKHLGSFASAYKSLLELAESNARAKPIRTELAKLFANVISLIKNPPKAERMAPSFKLKLADFANALALREEAEQVMENQKYSCPKCTQSFSYYQWQNNDWVCPSDQCEQKVNPPEPTPLSPRETIELKASKER